MNWFLFCIIWLILAGYLLRRFWFKQRLNKALKVESTKNMDVVRAAATIWTEALCQDFTPPLTAGDLEAFRESLLAAIFLEVYGSGVLPSLGMTGREQMGYVSRLSADTILKTAGKALNESRGYLVDLDSCLPLIEMRIDKEKVKVRPVSMGRSFYDFTVVYKAGDDVDTASVFGRRQRPAVPWSHEALLRGATKPLA